MLLYGLVNKNEFKLAFKGRFFWEEKYIALRRPGLIGLKYQCNKIPNLLHWENASLL